MEETMLDRLHQAYDHFLECYRRYQTRRAATCGEAPLTEAGQDCMQALHELNRVCDAALEASCDDAAADGSACSQEDFDTTALLLEILNNLAEGVKEPDHPVEGA